MPDTVNEDHFCRTVHVQLNFTRTNCGYCEAYVDSDADAAVDLSTAE